MTDVESVGLHEKDVTSKATSIKLMVRSLELRLAGYKWDAKGDKFVYTGNVLCGNNIITKATGLLDSFCQDSNLITGKQKETFAKQKYEICSVFNDILLSDMGCPAENQKTIMKMFKMVLINIGDIILDSKELMRPLFSKEIESSESMGGFG